MHASRNLKKFKEFQKTKNASAQTPTPQNETTGNEEKCPTEPQHKLHNTHLRCPILLFLGNNLYHPALAVFLFVVFVHCLRFIHFFYPLLISFCPTLIPAVLSLLLVQFLLCWPPWFFGGPSNEVEVPFSDFL